MEKWASATCLLSREWLKQCFPRGMAITCLWLGAACSPGGHPRFFQGHPQRRCGLAADQENFSMVPQKSRHVFVSRSICPQGHVKQTSGAILPAGLGRTVKRLENAFAEKTPVKEAEKLLPAETGRFCQAAAGLLSGHAKYLFAAEANIPIWCR